MPFLILLLAWPLAELWMLIQVAGRVGVFNTVLLCVFSAAGGVLLVQWQGLKTLAALREAASRGKMPVQEIFDGICIFLAGILLFLPGFISDAAGLLLLIAPVRHALRPYLARLFRGEPVIVDPAAPPPAGAVIDAEFTRLDEEADRLISSGQDQPRP